MKKQTIIIITIILGILLIANFNKPTSRGVSILSGSHFELSLKYDNDKISLIKLDMLTGQYSDKSDLGTYGADMTNAKGKILYSTKFDFPLFTSHIAPPGTFDEYGKQIKGVPYSKLETAQTTIFVPKYSDGTEIKIYEDKTNELKLTIDISKYSTCDYDNLCEANEDKILCPEDCDKDFKEKNWLQRFIDWILSLFKKTQ